MTAEDQAFHMGQAWEALPEPKQAGQGRSRVSRRATSSGSYSMALTVPEPEGDDKPEVRVYVNDVEDGTDRIVATPL